MSGKNARGRILQGALDGRGRAARVVVEEQRRCGRAVRGVEKQRAGGKAVRGVEERCGVWNSGAGCERAARGVEERRVGWNSGVWVRKSGAG